jgi:hypothetical protein
MTTFRPFKSFVGFDIVVALSALRTLASHRAPFVGQWRLWAVSVKSYKNSNWQVGRKADLGGGISAVL